MRGLNEWSYTALDTVMKLVLRFGLPLIILAWIGVLISVIGMIVVLRRHSMKGRWFPALAVGLLALAAHMFDFFGTLRICPDLAFEANPIWCIVVDAMGLRIAHWYGFTGKLLLSVLSFEFFAYYLIQRETLLPEKACGFFDFWRKFGASSGCRKVHMIRNMKNFFVFLFALIGPFCFYIALLNNIADFEVYMNMPSVPLVLVLYLLFLTAVYLAGNYWSFTRGKH
jgi:hypothetical protein